MKKQNKYVPFILVSCFVLWLLNGNSYARSISNTSAETEYYSPPTLSQEATTYLKGHPTKQPFNHAPAGISKLRKQLNISVTSRLERLMKADSSLSVKFEAIAGIPCYWASSAHTVDTDRIPLYTHGGAYHFGTAKNVIGLPLQIANAAGMRILSIEYRLAPEHPFPAAIEDTIKVYKWLLANDYRPENIGWFGASAGGGLALGTALALKQEGIPLPGAFALLSPWADLTHSGDTAHTLAHADPALIVDPDLLAWAKAYYGNNNPKDPRISPVYGDYTGFPAMLIQLGSKEIVLSDSVQIAWKARRVGVNVVLDIWDGMWHVFQANPKLPEAAKAIREIGTFFKQKLGQRPQEK